MSEDPKHPDEARGDGLDDDEARACILARRARFASVLLTWALASCSSDATTTMHDQPSGSGTATVPGSSSDVSSSQNDPGPTTRPASVPCVSGSPLPVHQSAVSGTFSGPNLDGYVCTGGAGAQLERTPGGQFLVLITNALTGPEADHFRFNEPADAARGAIVTAIGIKSASPGTYRSSDRTLCGGVSFCVHLPVPEGVQCPDPQGACGPPYCALQGPVLGPTCQPVPPSVCYSSEQPFDCVSSSRTPFGSWTLTLTSVTPYQGDVGTGAFSYYVIHGRLVATLVEQPGATGSGTTNAELSLSF